MRQRIGFVSTRFAGTDGVSLESAKWARVLWDHEHVSFWYAGRLDRASDVSMCVPEAFFGHPEIEWINERLWGRTSRTDHVSWRVRQVSDYLKETLYRFVDKFDITMLIVQNAMTIPMNVPLGVALAEFITETEIPTIAHHHDFYWERTRFSVNAASDYLEMAFPHRNPRIQHVVINQDAQDDLAYRKGLASLLVPNVLDFDLPPEPPDQYASDVREELELEPGDVMILQPTRVVPRKGIELAIQLVAMLGDKKYKLVVSHESGDEGDAYLHALQEMAHESNVDMRFVDARVGDRRQLDDRGKKVYTLWDLYPHAGLVTYPSLYEGFGNAFLEAIYFRVPLLVNRYSIFARDIEPKGFDLPVMDGYVTRRVADQVLEVLENPGRRKEMVDHNYEVARRFYSYSVLRRSLRTLITSVTGLDDL